MSNFDHHIPLVDRLMPAIRPYLEPFGLDHLERSTQSIYCYDANYTLAYFNPSWVSFGLENGSSEDAMAGLLGSNAIENWPGIMAKKFLEIFSEVLDASPEAPELPPSVRYLCHSPEKHREYSMDVLPLADRAGLLLINHLVVERKHTLERDTTGINYRDSTGYITQCANCSKVRHPQDPTRWDLVIEFLEHPILQTSHGLCQPCLQNYLRIHRHS